MKIKTILGKLSIENLSIYLVKRETSRIQKLDNPHTI